MYKFNLFDDLSTSNHWKGVSVDSLEPQNVKRSEENCETLIKDQENDSQFSYVITGRNMGRSTSRGNFSNRIGVPLDTNGGIPSDFIDIDSKLKTIGVPISKCNFAPQMINDEIPEFNYIDDPEPINSTERKSCKHVLFHDRFRDITGNVHKELKITDNTFIGFNTREVAKQEYKNKHSVKL